MNGAAPHEPDAAWVAHVDAEPSDRDAPESIVEIGGRSAKLVLLDGPALAQPLPAVDYLVREIGLVAGPGAPHLVAGYGFSGKTFAMQSLLLSLASGAPVWGLHRVEPRRVAHVDLEQGRLTVRRYQRLAPAMSVYSPDSGSRRPVELASLGDRLAVAIMPPISLAAEHTATWREIMTGRDLVLIDSLRAASGGQDENDSKIRACLDMLGTLSEETGCRAVVIHHARKPSADDPGGRYAIRGSSAIYDACDSVYVFSAAQGEPVLCEHVKARSHGEPTASIALVIEDVALDVEDEEGIPRLDARGGVRIVVHGAELVTQKREAAEAASRAQRARRDADRVRQAIVARPGIGARDLRAAAGLSGDRFAAALQALGTELDVREEQAGRTRRAAHYLKGASE